MVPVLKLVSLLVFNSHENPKSAILTSKFRYSARVPGDGLQRVQILQSFGGEDLVLAHARGGRQGHAGSG